MIRRRKQKQRWSDLGPRERAGIVAAGTVQISLTIAALVDLRRRDAAEVKGSKKAWTAAAFVNFIGPLAYFAFGRRR